MHSSIILSTLIAIAGLTSARPTIPLARDDTPYYGVSVGVITSPGLDPNEVLEPAPVQLNVLTICNGENGEGCSVSKLILQSGTASGGLDEDTIECRGYKDFAGVEPGSAPFNVSSPALISTNLATISSILCYIVAV